VIAAQPSALDQSEYRYARPVAVAPRRPGVVEADGLLFAHAQPGFSDLRFVDGRGAEIPWRPAPPELRAGRVGRSIRSMARTERGTRTVVVLDLGFAGTPVDRLRVTAAPRYDRRVTVLASDRGRRYGFVAGRSLVRFGEAPPPPLRLSARSRYLKLVIENGDDPPLAGIRVKASSASSALLIEPGHPGPYTALYGDRDAREPAYDFARLPVDEATLERAAETNLGRERPNPAFVPAPPELPEQRSFFARNEGLVGVALVLAALATVIAGGLALRGPRASV
jgi:hypothetical protein